MTDSSELPELQKTDTGAQTGATDTGAYKSKLQKLLELRVTDRTGATGSTPVGGAAVSARYYWSGELGATDTAPRAPRLTATGATGAATSAHHRIKYRTNNNWNYRCSINSR